MKASIPVTAEAPPFSWARTADYLELTKPRITLLVVITTLVGFYLGIATAAAPLLLLSHTLFGTAMVAGGASALNMYLERNLDSLMNRTAARPLPARRLHPRRALLFAALLSAYGVIHLALFVNPLTSGLSALTWGSYLFIYTPLKRRTWLCTLAGAVPGALPTLMGWAAATGTLSVGGWVLFAILFLWQLPHFYAIGWMYRDEYSRAGFLMLPVVDESGRRTSRQVALYVFALGAVSVLPWAVGMAGNVFLAGAVVTAAWMIWRGFQFARSRNDGSARGLFLASILYLPILLTLLMADKI